MIKKEIKISLNGFSVIINSIKISHYNNKKLNLFNNGNIIGFVDLEKFKFKFDESDKYTNYYRLIEK